MYTHRKPFPSPKGYNPNAIDADGDGIVQEGTPFERPAKKARKTAPAVIVEPTIEVVEEDASEIVVTDTIEAED